MIIGSANLTGSMNSGQLASTKAVGSKQTTSNGSLTRGNSSTSGDNFGKLSRNAANSMKSNTAKLINTIKF